MSAFRAGDKIAEINGLPHRLRLTVSGLAEMADVFDADSPKTLAKRLRTATLSDWNAVLGCVARPSLRAPLSRAEMVPLLPILGALISEGLRA